MEQRKLPAAATLLAIGLALALYGAARAQAPLIPPRDGPEIVSAPSPTPGLADLIRLSLQRNPSLAQAALDIGAAQGRAFQAGLYPNPTVSARGEELGGRQGPGGLIFAPEFSQEIVTAGKLGLSRAVGQREVRQANLNLVRQRYALFTAVRQAYFDVLTVQHRIEVLSRLLQETTKLFDTAKRFVKPAGELAQADILPVQVEVERLRTELEAAERELAPAWQRLAAVVGAPELPYRGLAGSLEAAVPDYAFEPAREQVLTLHPEIGSAQAGVARAQLALRRAQVEPIPNVTVGAGYLRNNIDREDQWTFQVGVPIPVFNRNQGNIVAAQAELGRAVRDVERVQNNLINRLATAFGQYVSARQRAARYRALLPLAQKSYQTILAGVPARTQFAVEFLRVLQAQQTLVTINQEYVRALSDQWRAASEIAGLLLEEYWPDSILGPCTTRPRLPAGTPVMSKSLGSEVQRMSAKRS